MKIKTKKYIIWTGFILLLFVFSANFVFAGGEVVDGTVDGIGGKIVAFLTWVLIWIAAALGKLLTLLMEVLYQLFGGTKFTNAGVDMGWAAARDVSNMFFILILLLISFATILRLENYSMKRYLPKLLLMAVLINYSKTITLLLIDFSQIVMLTFANSFASQKSSFVTLLHLNELTKINTQTNDIALSNLNIFYGVFLYALFIAIAFCVIFMLIGILVMRMVMFWILIVLSPLAFMAYAVPGGSGYFGRWTSELSKYLVVGPVLAFFTWLSMVTMQAASSSLENFDIKNTSAAQMALSEMGSADNIMSFIVAIGMLIGTIKITQSVGAMGGGLGAGMAMGLKNKSISLGKKGLGVARGAALGTAKTSSKYIGRQALSLTGAGLQAVSPKGSSVSNVGKMASNWSSNLSEARNKTLRDNRLKMLKKMGMDDSALKSAQDVADSKLGRNFKTTVGAVGTGLAMASGAPIAATIAGGLTGYHVIKRAFGGSADKDKKARQADKDAINQEREKELLAAKTDRDNDELYKKQVNLKNSNMESAKKRMDDGLDDLSRRKKNEEIGGKEYNEERKAIVDAFADREKSINKAFVENLDVKTANQVYENKVKYAEDKHTTKLSSINNREKSFSEKYFSDYHPNKVMMEATKEGLKESEAARKKVQAMKIGNFHDNFNKNDFYSTGGFSSLQKKFWDELASGSADSLLALKQIESTLEDIKEEKIEPTSIQFKVIQHMKQGAAAWSKKGGDLSKLGGLVSSLDGVKTGDGDDTVAGFESKIIT